MRILVVSSELPYPASHGGRVDIWSRLGAMAQAGAQVHLVCWFNQFNGDVVDEACRAALGRVVQGLTVFPVNRVFARPLALLHTPAAAMMRQVGHEALAPHLPALQAFAPDAVWLDGLFGGPLAMDLARQLGKPLYYRAHNIEHRYVAAQYQRAVGWRNKLVGLANLYTTRPLEDRVLSQARRYFDISNTDLAFWQQQGYTNGEWLPTIVDSNKAAALSDTTTWQPNHDVAYVGNLYAPNNVQGVLWLLREVLPLLRAARPGMSLLLAGARPVPEVRAAAAQAGVTLMADPVDVVPCLRDARVLVNPVFAGSGVNIKSVEMLFTPAALVAAPMGLQGLSPQVCAQFAVAVEPADFSQAILTQLAQVAPPAADRLAARQDFEPAQVARVVAHMQAELGLPPTQARAATLP